MSEVTILDGGMGRELSRIGAPFRLPEWSALALIEAPDMVRQVHDAFIHAGAEVITANSYALTPHQLGTARFAADATTLADRAGRLARSAAMAAPDRGIRVAASLPPLFGSYRPWAFEPATAPGILARLVEGLAPHVDLWLIETQSAIAEMLAAVQATRAAPPRPVWVSFTLADAIGVSGPPRLRSGETVPDAVAAARAAGAAVVLFNCSQAETMLPALQAARQGDGGPLGAYANAFQPEPEAEEAYPGISDMRGDLGPAAYRDHAAAWVAAGASVIGGCCGIGPDHIAALRAWRDGVAHDKAQS